MSQNFRIALRFLTAKKRAMLMSLSCIILGVGLFIVTQAATSGFQEFFIKTILGTNGAIMIQDQIQDTMRSIDDRGYNSGYEIRMKEGVKYIEGIEYPDRLYGAVKSFRNVPGSRRSSRDGHLRSSFREQSGQAYGINIEDHLKVSDLGTRSSRARSTTSGRGRAPPWGGDRRTSSSSRSASPSRSRTRRHPPFPGRGHLPDRGQRHRQREGLHRDGRRPRSLQEADRRLYLQVNLFDRDRAREDAAEMTNSLAAQGRRLAGPREVLAGGLQGLRDRYRPSPSPSSP